MHQETGPAGTGQGSGMATASTGASYAKASLTSGPDALFDVTGGVSILCAWATREGVARGQHVLVSG
jgi:hypothetical protein